MHRETIRIKSVFWTVPGAAIAAAVANLLVFFMAKFVFGITPIVPSPASSFSVLPLLPSAVAWASIVLPFLGGVLFVLLGIFFPWRPVTVFRVIALVVFLGSLYFPFVIPIAVDEKIILALMHLVAFGITVVMLTGPWGMWKPPVQAEAFKPKF